MSHTSFFTSSVIYLDQVFTKVRSNTSLVLAIVLFVADPTHIFKYSEQQLLFISYDSIAVLNFAKDNDCFLYIFLKNGFSSEKSCFYFSRNICCISIWVDYFCLNNHHRNAVFNVIPDISCLFLRKRMFSNFSSVIGYLILLHRQRQLFYFLDRSCILNCP